MITLTVIDLVDSSVGIFFEIIFTKASEPFFQRVQQQGLKHYGRSWFSEDTKKVESSDHRFNRFNNTYPFYLNTKILAGKGGEFNEPKLSNQSFL